MTYLTDKEFYLEAARGNIAGVYTVNKFGEATDCDDGIDTDIWDGADGTTSTDVWVQPTTARIHDITSTDVDDTSAGTGMRTVRIYGLTDWDTAETSEDVTLNGTSNVATSNSYVIIHRMKGLTFGSTGSNEGIITATAQTDATVTAAIQAGEGQTLMAIYGIPSTQKIYLLQLGMAVLKRSGLDASMDATLLVKEHADLSTSGFITKERLQGATDSPVLRVWGVPKLVTGPAIIKVQVNANANDVDVTASFDAVVVDN